MKQSTSILIADDSPTERMLLQKTLSSAGYEVIAAESGVEALEILKERTPDLICLDVVMPQMTGYEVTAKIRQNEKTRLLPVILVTSLSETKDRIEGIEAGCDEFLTKPYNKNEILARVKNLLKLSYYRQLLDEKDKFENVIQQMNQGIAVLDANFKLIHLNQKAQDLLEVKQLSDDFDLLAYMKDSFETPANLSYDDFSHKKSFDLVRPETKEFNALVLSVTSNLIKNPNQEITSYLWMIEDVSQQRREDFMKSTFLGLISHKLNTPLTVLLQNLSILEQGYVGDLNAEQSDIVKRSEKRAEELTRIVNKLLGFTMLYGPTQNKNFEKIHLNQFIFKTSHAWRESFKFKDKKISFEFDVEDGDYYLNAEVNDLNIILDNLFENAYNFHDGDEVVLKIKIFKQEDGVTLAISDNSRGIPPEEKEKVFSRFYQIDRWNTGQIKGLGLGLSMVKTIVESYDGSVKLDSQVGQGSTFYLSFPSAFSSFEASS